LTVHDLLVSSTVLASFLGGVVALFAPCCMSVMLPAYFATGFRQRAALVSMTFVFALGVAAVIEPIALGATGISRLISGHHTPVFLAGAALMGGLGIATLGGWKLPMLAPAMRAGVTRGPAAVFALGAFSGVATACCAPVLAGVVALSGAAGSFLVALVVGAAYVFGMVAPLFIMAVMWDRFDWGNSALLRGRTVTIHAFGRRRAIHSTALLAGLLMIGMAGLVGVLAVTGPDMPNRGWQVSLSARLQHYAAVVTHHVSATPGVVWLAVLLVAIGWLSRKAVVQRANRRADRDPTGSSGPTQSPTDDVHAGAAASSNAR
jgi:cytochrome c-type biogenesis protein